MACDPPSVQTILTVALLVGLGVAFLWATVGLIVWMDRMTR